MTKKKKHGDELQCIRETVQTIGFVSNDTPEKKLRSVGELFFHAKILRRDLKIGNIILFSRENKQ